jgi:hypothetical protein
LEWYWLIKAFYDYNGLSLCNPNPWTNCIWGSETSIFPKFRDGLKLPLVGLRNRSNGLVGEAGRGYYWSSSPSSYESAAYNIIFISSRIIPQYTANSSYGFPIRCFKN